MSVHCCREPSRSAPAVDPRYRKALWLALALNATMFGVETMSSWTSGSVSLLADAIDFLGDAGNYAITLAVLGMGVAARSRAALFKAACMGAFGVLVIARVLWALAAGIAPEAATMGLVGAAALAVNAGVALMLYRFRSGDAKHALGVDLLAQRCARQSRGPACSAGRVRYRKRLARRRRRRRHGRPRADRFVDGAAAGARRAAKRTRGDRVELAPAAAGRSPLLRQTVAARLGRLRKKKGHRAVALARSFACAQDGVRGRIAALNVSCGTRSRRAT